ncbi:predicted protein [Naegleria gruberi]|uniref:Predicted protein n=1 Tax=Naegleria gruberi TaxID=5762 RepID=D2VDT8_NAEGR|nr:uncharacterized protein NAEGRDRAFT_48735 [Naegleria gruberi]EFC45056.1 predicted protein [Naegleria gruberi]|eukprot:XP_002677800.1 predicted protein [Naegleria gruberi strain NEG-M]
MTRFNPLVLACFVLLAALLTSSSFVNASSPAEPAFKSQLRSCFEANRNTECLATQSSWSSCGGSVYSSYQLALSISMNCMRSVCGSQNSLCCNTYCTMYGLSGYDHSVCFNKCFNGYTGSVVSAAATLMKPISTSIAYASIPFDDNSDFVPKSATTDDKAIVKCSVSCDATYAFYFANEQPTRKERNFLRTLLSQINGSNSTTGTASGNGGVSVLGKKKKLFISSFVKKTKLTTIKNGKVTKSTSKSSGKTDKKMISNVIQVTRDRLQVFDISLDKVVPLNPVLKSSQVGKNQICANTGKTVEVTYYKRSRVNCNKIQRWMKEVSEISPNNLLTVYKFMMIVHNKCRSLIPKKSKQCVVPMFRRINLNTDTL